MRAAEPRASSSASGFRFCGIMLEPDVNAVAELHEAELARAVDDQILGETRQMRPDHRRREQHLGDEIAIADRVDRVRRQRVEAKRALKQDARDRIRAAGHRAGAEWQHGRRALGGAQSRAIALERPEMREQPVRRRDRNGALQVRVRRHERRLERRAWSTITCCSDANRARRAAWQASIVHSRVAVAT